MATLIKHQGIPFEDLFDPDIIGDGPIAHRCTHNGQPLRFAHIQYGAKRADVNFRVNNQDVSNLWAAKGTASYVSDGGFGGRLRASDVGYPSAKATATFYFNADGTTRWTSETNGGQGGGVWSRSQPGEYDILFTQVAANVEGFLQGTLNAWLPLTESRWIALTVSASRGRQATATRTVRAQIRRRQDGRIWMDKTMEFYCTVASDG
ncbi:hypothetical protein [Lysobacter sp. CA199]|uniref:hypothetical protein n=1 Tax=Lysobacter sp. CA199 TaxID=3455608 RepID=UPI003F8D0E96